LNIVIFYLLVDFQIVSVPRHFFILYIACLLQSRDIHTHITLITRSREWVTWLSKRRRDDVSVDTLHHS